MQTGTKKTTRKSKGKSNGFGLKQKLAVLRTFFLIIISITAGFLGGWLGAQSQYEEGPSRSVGQQVVTSEGQLITDLAQEIGPSVVSVNVRSTEATGFFGLQQLEGSGTGFIVSDDGIVVTNRHVVPANTDSISIVLSDGTELSDVDVIGRTNEGDPLDVAFLRINDAKGKELTALSLGDSAETKVGDKVIAIGNALGQFQNTVTSGIISGYGREIQASDGSGFGSDVLQNLFQTDAAINQGNSGGPLVNMNGEVIGINTAVAGSGAENIGFAIPINDAKGLIDSVLETGELERPYLGVRYVNLTDDYAYEYNLEVSRGAYILPDVRGQSSILPDSPADKADLQPKDIITEVDGEPINERNSLISLIGRHQVGEEVTLTIVRGGEEQKVDVTLEATPEN